MGPTWRGSTGNSDSSARGPVLAIQVAVLLLSIKQSGAGGVYLEMNSVLGRFVTNRNSYLFFVGDLWEETVKVVTIWITPICRIH